MSQDGWEPRVEETAQGESCVSIQGAPQSQPKTVALSVDEFDSLEERVVRAVSLIRRERQARTVAEERANELEARLQQQEPQVTQLHEEIKQLRGERDEVRQRIERLLTQLDTLEL